MVNIANGPSRPIATPGQTSPYQGGPLLNQIAFERQPDDLILDPYRARNLAALRQPDFLWRPIPRSQISGFAASAHSEINALID